MWSRRKVGVSRRTSAVAASDTPPKSVHAALDGRAQRLRDLPHPVCVPGPVRAATLGPGAIVPEDRSHVEGVLPGLGRGERLARRARVHPGPGLTRLRLRRVAAQVRNVDVVGWLVPALDAVLVADQGPAALGLLRRPLVRDRGAHRGLSATWSPVRERDARTAGVGEARVDRTL